MATIWEESWTEIWSDGHGRSRSHCGIAVTEDGFAVDVFRGDTCVDSTLHHTWEIAVEHALSVRLQHAPPPSPTSPGWDRPAIQ